MDRLLNSFKGHAAAMDSQRGQPRFATVVGVDARRGLVKVRIEPEGQVTGWIPVARQGAGAGWGIVTVPRSGDQAVVLPDMGEGEHPVVIGFTHAHQSGGGEGEQPKAPGDIAGADLEGQPGETIAVGPDGTVLRFGAGGVFIRGNLRVEGTITASDVITSKADVVAERDVLDSHGSIQRLRANYNSHDHTARAVGAPTRIDPV